MLHKAPLYKRRVGGILVIKKSKKIPAVSDQLREQPQKRGRVVERRNRISAATRISRSKLCLAFFFFPCQYLQIIRGLYHHGLRWQILSAKKPIAPA